MLLFFSANKLSHKYTNPIKIVMLNYLHKQVYTPMLQLRTQSVSKAYTSFASGFINACFSIEKFLALLFVYIWCRGKKSLMESDAEAQLKKERTRE